MKVALINGSPKPVGSTSEILLKDLTRFTDETVQTSMYHFKKAVLPEVFIEAIDTFEALVFAFPLYVDGIPSQLFACLRQLEQLKCGSKKVKIYCIVNCGFYEGTQNQIAMDIMKHWCKRAGYEWGMGIGVDRKSVV